MNATLTLETNPDVIPPWMFRDALVTYLDYVHEQVWQKYVDGDLAVKKVYDSVEYMLEILDQALPTDTEKFDLVKKLTNAKKKLADILGHTI
jgi:hypothetical protein